MHGTIGRDTPTLARPTLLYCIRKRTTSIHEAPLYSPWERVTREQYNDLLLRMGYTLPHFGLPCMEASGWCGQGRIIYRVEQIAEWDQDLRALYWAHRAQVETLQAVA